MLVTSFTPPSATNVPGSYVASPTYISATSANSASTATPRILKSLLEFKFNPFPIIPVWL